MTISQSSCGSAPGADGVSPPAEDELLHLMHGPTGSPTTCGGCGEEIVQMPKGHYRTTSKDYTRDRLVCEKAQDRKHRPETTPTSHTRQRCEGDSGWEPPTGGPA